MLGLSSVLVQVGCGQIIEVPVESAGTEVSTSGGESSTTGADETSGDGSTTDVDRPTGSDETETSTGGAPERVTFCVSGTMALGRQTMIDVPVDVVDVADASDVRVGVRVLRPADDALTVTVTRGGETRTLLDADVCLPMADLLFDDLGTLEAGDACSGTQQVGTVVPVESLAPLLDDPNGTWIVGVAQSEASGSVESVCVSFGEPDTG